MTSISRTTVTQRIKNIKQPWGGYLPIKNFRVVYFQDDIDIDFLDLTNENISASLMGTVIDYLTRYYVKGQYGEKNSVLNAFDIAWLGARNLGSLTIEYPLLVTLSTT